VLPEPLDRQSYSGRSREIAATADGPSYLDTMLEPGDALYLPRGWLHAADALDEQSLHITVGVHAPTRYTILQALLELASDEQTLRAGLPMGVDTTDADALAPALADTVKALYAWLDRLSAADVTAALRAPAWGAVRPAPLAPLAQTAAIAALNGDSRLTVRSGLPWRLERPSAARITLRLPDRSVTFPAFCADAVRAALRDSPILVRELPGLDAEDQLVLARRLLREAVLVPAWT
jgi:hypothetical protein